MDSNIQPLSLDRIALEVLGRSLSPVQFLDDFPWFGARARVTRRIKKLLNSRPIDVLKLWGDDSRRLRALSIVSQIIISANEWDSGFFIPDDEIFTVIYDPSHDMKDVAFLLDLEDRFPLVESFMKSADENTTIGSLIDEIVNRYDI